MGSPGFAIPALDRLAADHDVIAVYTQPPRRSGGHARRHRSRSPRTPPRSVWSFAIESLKTDEDAATLAALKPMSSSSSPTA